MPDPALQLLGFVLAILTAAAALTVAIRKTGPEVAAITSDTAIDLGRRVQELEQAIDSERDGRRIIQSELAAVQMVLANVKFEVSLYKAGTRLLVAQVEAAGMVAAWHPPA